MVSVDVKLHVSFGLAILLTAWSRCRLSWERWLHPLPLLGQVLLVCCRLQLTSLSSMIVLQPLHLREGWGSRPLCVWGRFSTDGSPLALWLYSSEQYSVHWFSICLFSVRHFPEQSWTVVDFPCFTVVKSFTSWYALLLLIFLRLFSITTLSYWFFFCLFHAPLNVAVDFLVFLRSFRFKSFLS